METPNSQGYNLFGQPLLKHLKCVEVNRLPNDPKTARKSLSPHHSQRGPVSGSDGLSASECTMEYLGDLIKEKKHLSVFPQLFPHMERLVDEEINRVRSVLFQCPFVIDNVDLPEPKGDPIMVQEKIYVPYKEHPDYNFVGRILGPRGLTAKQLEKDTGCKIMVRGRGSLRDSRKEEQNRGKPNWEHLDDDLHVLLQCEDTPNRVYSKLKTGVELIKKLLIPCEEGIDDLKRKQLLELAIINGTFRPVKQILAPNPPQLITTPVTLIPSPIRRSPQPLPLSLPTQPIFISPLNTSISSITNLAPNASTINHFMQAPNIDYSMLTNQISIDPTLSSSYSIGANDECAHQSDNNTPFMNTINGQLSNALMQPYVINSNNQLTPPLSNTSDHH